MVATAGAMNALQRAVSVVENNIVNASTVGYARQDMNLVANPFNPNTSATSGGVTTGPMESGRNGFLESSVWRAQHKASYSSSLSGKLTELERAFPLASGSGLSSQIDRFFGAISQWSVAPNSAVARELVLDRASAVTQAFHQTAGDLSEAARQGGAELNSAVRHVNALTSQVAKLNQQRRESRGGANDAGLDAHLHATLEELSQYISFTALPQEDGAVTILGAGGTTLVIGNNQYSISVAATATGYQILDPEDLDITASMDQGKLGALLEYRNTLVPGYEAEVNAMAESFAFYINGTLASGIDQSGNAPSKIMFNVNPGLGAATTIQLTDITAAELTGALPGDPGGNGNVLNFLALKNQPVMGGLTFSQYFADTTAKLGDRLNAEKADSKVQSQLLLQAQSLRSQTSGVDINVEATKLLQLQKSFQAAGQVMSVLNSMTETLLGMLR
jgi:flagellar hook-associated protein 1 FlgK